MFTVPQAENKERSNAKRKTSAKHITARNGMVCKACGIEKPLEAFPLDRLLCKICYRRHDRDRQLSPEYKAKLRKYKKRPEVRARLNESRKRYAKTEIGTEKRKAYELTVLRRIRQCRAKANRELRRATDPDRIAHYEKRVCEYDKEIARILKKKVSRR
jgi:hypothetical protein